MCRALALLQGGRHTWPVASPPWLYLQVRSLLVSWEVMTPQGATSDLQPQTAKVNDPYVA